MKNDKQPELASEGIRRGRFESGMNSVFQKFNSSIEFDRRLYREDIMGSIAHVRMLGKQDIIGVDEAGQIEAGLLDVLSDIENGKLVFSHELEDVHINIEDALKKKIGPVAGKLHTARSRNDQVALDIRLYLRGRSSEIRRLILDFIDELINKAEAEIDLIMPGYTHLQRAQPVRLGHHLCAYAFMLKRDFERFQSTETRTSESPLGSAALAGSSYPIDRHAVANSLGLYGVIPNSMDAVSDRDFAVEFVFNCSVLMMHLSRMAEEFILWASQEFGFCSLPDAYCSGSSIMPQKKNPDACELVRGKTGRVYGDLIGMLTTLKALPLTYNKDLQEDKEPVFDAEDTVVGCLQIMNGVVQGMNFKPDRMLRAASDPSLAATDLADRAAKSGMPFREAHEMIGAKIRQAVQGIAAEDLPSPEELVEARNHIGGTSRESVIQQIAVLRDFCLQSKNRLGY